MAAKLVRSHRRKRRTCEGALYRGRSCTRPDLCTVKRNCRRGHISPSDIRATKDASISCQEQLLLDPAHRCRLDLQGTSVTYHAGEAISSDYFYSFVYSTSRGAT